MNAMEHDEDALVASVLAFLDDFYSNSALPNAAEDTADHSSTSGAEEPRRDANRARKEAQKELLELRAAVTALEHELQLRRRIKRSRESTSQVVDSAAGTGAASVWRETAASQLTQRVRVETENMRLRGLVGDTRTVLWTLRNKLLGHATTQAVRQFGVMTGATNLPPFDLKVMAVLQNLSMRVNAVYARAGANTDSMLGIHDVWSPAEVSPSGRPSLIDCGPLQKLVARRLVPFGVRKTGDAAWEHFTRVIRPQAMSLFSHRTAEGGDRSANTVIEYFGMKLTHEDTSAEFRVTQVMKRFSEPNRDVIIWESVVDPIAMNDRRLDGISFRETGRVLITPHASSVESSSPFSIAETSYAVAPPTQADGSVSAHAADISDFVLRSMATVIRANYYKIENLLLSGM